MEVLMYDAEKELAGFIRRIGEMESSAQWLCLHVQDSAFEELRNNREQLYVAEDLVLSYLQDVEGKAFFCGDQDLYVVARDIPYDVLEGVGRKLCEILFEQNVSDPKISVFKLTAAGAEYVSDVEDKGHLFKLSPVAFLVQEGFDRIAVDNPMNYLSPGKAKLIEEENRKPRVLLIEDDRTTRTLVSQSLEPYCQMVTARDASEGVEKFMSTEPDLVFLDIGLPDASGHNVLDWMLWNDPEANVVVFSGNSDMQNMSRAMDHGAKGFVAKPFVKKHLLRYITECPQHKKLH